MNLIKKTIEYSQNKGFLGDNKFRRIDFSVRKIYSDSVNVGNSINLFMLNEQSDLVSDSIKLLINSIDLYSLLNLEKDYIEFDNLSSIVNDTLYFKRYDAVDDELIEIQDQIDMIESNNSLSDEECLNDDMILNINKDYLEVNRSINRIVGYIGVDLSDTSGMYQSEVGVHLKNHISEILIELFVNISGILVIVVDYYKEKSVDFNIQEIWEKCLDEMTIETEKEEQI